MLTGGVAGAVGAAADEDAAVADEDAAIANTDATVGLVGLEAGGLVGLEAVVDESAAGGLVGLEAVVDEDAAVAVVEDTGAAVADAKDEGAAGAPGGTCVAASTLGHANTVPRWSIRTPVGSCTGPKVVDCHEEGRSSVTRWRKLTTALPTVMDLSSFTKSPLRAGQ